MLAHLPFLSGFVHTTQRTILQQRSLRGPVRRRMSTTDRHTPPLTDSVLQDTFGPFSDAAAASGSDPFTFASASAEEPEHLEDASFESFGDFGDFQSADSGSADGGGAGSWTLASSSSTGSLDEFGGGGSPQQKAERTQ